MIRFVRIFARKKPMLISPAGASKMTKNPTILYGSTKGHNTGLKGCIGMSNRIWNILPKVQDKIKNGFNLHN